ncbi:hypothetical protein D3C77_333210 [compost metagenome]
MQGAAFAVCARPHPKAPVSRCFSDAFRNAPGLATGDRPGYCVSGAGQLPAADCRAGGSSSVWAVSFLPMAAISICSPWITGPYNMHATALNARVIGGRVHEVRRPSMPKLRALIQMFMVLPLPLTEVDTANPREPHGYVDSLTPFPAEA